MTRVDLLAIFRNKAIVKDKTGKIMGWGLSESNLIMELGFSKSELKKLAREGVLDRIQASAPRKRGFLSATTQVINVYVLKGTADEIEKTKTSKEKNPDPVSK